MIKIVVCLNDEIICNKCVFISTKWLKSYTDLSEDIFNISRDYGEYFAHVKRNKQRTRWWNHAVVTSKFCIRVHFFDRYVTEKKKIPEKKTEKNKEINSFCKENALISSLNISDALKQLFLVMSVFCDLDSGYLVHPAM